MYIYNTERNKNFQKLITQMYDRQSTNYYYPLPIPS